MLVPDVVERTARVWPRRTALLEGNESITFADLRDRVRRLANGFGGAGLTPGSAVLDLQSNGLAYVISDLAMAAAGLVRVPLNSRLALANLLTIVADSQAHTLIYDPDHAELAAELAAAAPELEFAICTRDSPFGDVSFQDLEAKASSSRPSFRARAGDVVSINFSSGTTGRPKGCLRTYGNRSASAYDMLLALYEGQLRPSHTFLHAGPITHASGLMVLPCIAAGATQRIMPRFDADEALSFILSGEIDATVLVPTMIERVMGLLDASGRRCQELTWLAYAGAPMHRDRVAHAIEMFPGALTQFYGLVEAIPPITVLTRADHDRDDLLERAGRPVPGVNLEIIDDNGHALATGEIGEVLVSGPHVMAGYCRTDGTDGKQMTADGLRTGDLGWLDDEGNLQLVDRRGDMIITGGYNVYPREVEDVLRAHPGVADVVVVGVPDTDWGQAVTAIVVARPGREHDEAGLRELAGSGLAGFKKPKSYHLIDELPKTAIGKIDRKALAARFTP